MDTIEFTIINARPQYYTGDVFKRDVELNLGYFVPNSLWIQCKPKKSLPWSNSDLKETLSQIKSQEAVVYN
jgi:hypothetical protein